MDQKVGERTFQANMERRMAMLLGEAMGLARRVKRATAIGNNSVQVVYWYVFMDLEIHGIKKCPNLVRDWGFLCHFYHYWCRLPDYLAWALRLHYASAIAFAATESLTALLIRLWLLWVHSTPAQLISKDEAGIGPHLHGNTILFRSGASHSQTTTQWVLVLSLLSHFSTPGPRCELMWSAELLRADQLLNVFSFSASCHWKDFECFCVWEGEWKTWKSEAEGKKGKKTLLSSYWRGEMDIWSDPFWVHLVVFKQGDW